MPTDMSLPICNPAVHGGSMNCPHSSSGWCVQCVSRLRKAVEDYFDNDGSRNRFSAFALDEARTRCCAALHCSTPDEMDGSPDRPPVYFAANSAARYMSLPEQVRTSAASGTRRRPAAARGDSCPIL